MSLDFSKYAAKGNEFLNIVADELSVPQDKAGRITRAVLHALRNRLSYEESFHLLAQLPIVLKGVYVDGWQFNKEFVRINHVNEFLDEVRKEDGGLAAYDFGNNEKAANAVAAVFKALGYFVSDGEMNDVTGMLPVSLQNFLEKRKSGRETVL